MIRRPPRSTRTDTPFPYTTLFRSTVPSKRRLRWALLPVGIATAAVLSGCSPSQLHGFLPGFQEDGVPTTDRVDMVSGLWVNSWIVLLVVGLVTWGLMLWAAIADRKSTRLNSSH